MPPAWLLIPSIEIGETFNDNVNLAPKGSTVWDFITTVTPALNLTGQTARLNLGLTYDPQELIFARSSPSTTLQQRLLGTGTAELWHETLFFDANASISQAFIRPTGPIGPTTLTTNTNLQTVYAASASPYLQQHLGSYADAETRYRFSTVSTSGGGIAPENINELRQTLLGGEFFGRLGWKLTGDLTRIERAQSATDPTGGTSGKDILARADFKYPIYQALSLVGGAGYERITDPTLTIQPDGPIWNVGFSYQPNELVSATLTYGERFDKSDIELNATYNLDPQLRLSAIYTETIQTSQSQIAGNLNQVTLDPVTHLPIPNPIIPGSPGTPGTPGSPSSGSFGVSSGAFLAKTAELDATLTKERNTYSVRGYLSKQTSSSAVTATAAAPATAERILGGTATWSHQLRPDLTSSALANYYRATFLDGSGRIDNAYLISLAFTYTLSRTASATISLSRSDLRSNIPADSLASDIVMATIRKQF